jgi:hypothetical protein
MCQSDKLRAGPLGEATALQTVNGALHGLLFNNHRRIVIHEIE